MGSKQDLIFYAIAGTLIGLMATALGASTALVIFASLLVPPLLLIAYRIFR